MDSKSGVPNMFDDRPIRERIESLGQIIAFDYAQMNGIPGQLTSDKFGIEEEKEN